MSKQNNENLDSALDILYDIAQDFDIEYNKTGWYFDKDDELLEYLKGWLKYLDDNTKEMKKYINKYYKEKY